MIRHDLKSEIISKLDGAFSDIPIRGEKTERNADVEFIFVKEISMNYLPQIGDFKRIHYYFVIEYYPAIDEQRKRQQLRDVELKLFDVFGLWHAERGRAFNMNPKFENDRLDFYVEFNVRYEIIGEAEATFENLDLSVGVGSDG